MQTFDITEDYELIREYVADDSQKAFKTLFRKYFGLVYSAAKRITRDPDLACDVAQCVFHQFARKACTFRESTHLPGWLHKAAVFEASKVVRTECRRRQREFLALQDQDSMDESALPNQDGISIESQLDEAIAKLGSEDRHLVLLRFWQKLSARQMGQILGLSEAAAQKRLTRALEKLRGQLAVNGIVPELALLSATLHTAFSCSAPASIMTKAAGYLSAEAAFSHQGWLASLHKSIQKFVFMHRSAATAALLATNAIIWSGFSNTPELSASLHSNHHASTISWSLESGWNNVRDSVSLVVDVSFTTLGVYPAHSSSGSGGRLCL